MKNATGQASTAQTAFAKGGLQLATGHGHHLNSQGMPANSKATPEMGYATASQTNLDNNSVDMDRERANFADNTVRYEATLRFINGQVRTLNTAITGQ